MFIYTALPIFRNHFDCEKIVDESRVVIWRNIKSFRKRLFFERHPFGEFLKTCEYRGIDKIIFSGLGYRVLLYVFCTKIRESRHSGRYISDPDANL